MGQGVANAACDYEKPRPYPISDRVMRMGAVMTNWVAVMRRPDCSGASGVDNLQQSSPRRTSPSSVNELQKRRKSPDAHPPRYISVDSKHTGVTVMSEMTLQAIPTPSNKRGRLPSVWAACRTNSSAVGARWVRPGASTARWRDPRAALHHRETAVHRRRDGPAQHLSRQRQHVSSWAGRLGLIRRQHRRGERREYFESLSDVWEICTIIAPSETPRDGPGPRNDPAVPSDARREHARAAAKTRTSKPRAVVSRAWKTLCPSRTRSSKPSLATRGRV